MPTAAGFEIGRDHIQINFNALSELEPGYNRHETMFKANMVFKN